MTESDNNNWPNYDAREPQQSSLAGKVRRLIEKKWPTKETQQEVEVHQNYQLGFEKHGFVWD